MGVCVVNRSDLVEVPCDRAEGARLRAVNAELLAACHANLDEWRKFVALNLMQQGTVDQTRAAIAKATEVTT